MSETTYEMSPKEKEDFLKQLDEIENPSQVIKDFIARYKPNNKMRVTHVGQSLKRIKVDDE